MLPFDLGHHRSLDTTSRRMFKYALDKAVKNKVGVGIISCVVISYTSVTSYLCIELMHIARNNRFLREIFRHRISCRVNLISLFVPIIVIPRETL